MGYLEVYLNSFPFLMVLMLLLLMMLMMMMMMMMMNPSETKKNYCSDIEISDT